MKIIVPKFFIITVMFMHIIITYDLIALHMYFILYLKIRACA